MFPTTHGDLKLVWGLRVHKCTKNVDVYSDFDQNEAHFLIRDHKWYNSAKLYTIHQRGHFIDKKNLSRVKFVKYGQLTLCLR